MIERKSKPAAPKMKCRVCGRTLYLARSGREEIYVDGDGRATCRGGRHLVDVAGGWAGA